MEFYVIPLFAEQCFLTMPDVFELGTLVQFLPGNKLSPPGIGEKMWGPNTSLYNRLNVDV